MLVMVWGLIAIILTLLLVVGIHEMGHALMARVFSVRIYRIAIGFGRPILQWRNSTGCQWVWALWPLGGCVELANTRIHSVEPEMWLGCFDKKPIWQRIIILMAGALANVITAWFALTLVFYLGLPGVVPQIKTITPGSIAAKVGIRDGDQFIAVANQKTSTWQEVSQELLMVWGKPKVRLIVAQSNASPREIWLDLSHIQFDNQHKSLFTSLGVKPELQAQTVFIKAPNLVDAGVQAWWSMIHWLYFFVVFLKQILMGIIPFFVLLGPLGLFTLSVLSFTHGVAVFLYFIAGLSLAVAFINLLPIPGLDGGTLMYALIEKIRGKAISVAMEILLYRLAMIAAAMILVQLILNDVNKLA